MLLFRSFHISSKYLQNNYRFFGNAWYSIRCEESFDMNNFFRVKREILKYFVALRRVFWGVNEIYEFKKTSNGKKIKENQNLTV